MCVVFKAPPLSKELLFSTHFELGGHIFSIIQWTLLDIFIKQGSISKVIIQMTIILFPMRQHDDTKKVCLE